jgi:phospholipase C
MMWAVRRVSLGPAAALLTLSLLAQACRGTTAPTAAQARGHIRHVIFIVQENRSFDHYFGTFPGADGIPTSGSTPSVCVPDPQLGRCVRPYHDPSLTNAGGPHEQIDAGIDVDGGKMDGFVTALRTQGKHFCQKFTFDPACTDLVGASRRAEVPDVMGWHDAREIPNYWAYAERYVLQDRMFESAFSWSLPSHLFLVSGWSADCGAGTPPRAGRTSIDPGTSTRARRPRAPSRGRT